MKSPFMVIIENEYLASNGLHGLLYLIQPSLYMPYGHILLFMHCFNIMTFESNIIMIPEKVHKTYYMIIFFKLTTAILFKDLKNKPASTGCISYV